MFRLQTDQRDSISIPTTAYGKEQRIYLENGVQSHCVRLTVSAPLVNRTALVGSRYPVFAQVQYDDEGVHQTVAAQGMVAIDASHSFFEKWRTWFVVGAVVLVAMWLAILLWWALTTRSRRAETGP